MLCFGQSAFFRFNHPEEALRMKSLLPGGLSMPKTQPAGKDPVQMIIEGGSGSSQQLVRLIDSESQCGSDCRKK